MSIRDCLSMLEIVAYRAGEDPDGRTEQHLAECARCRVLVADFRGLDAPAYSELETSLPRIDPRPAPDLPDDVKTGQLWAATVEGDADWREMVVVLASHPSVDKHELVLVAPVSTELDDATSADVLLEDSPLGYRHLVSVGLQGVVLRDQLERYLGRLDRPIREALATAYHDLLSGSEPTAQASAGLPLAGPDDPRALARGARADVLSALFAPASRLLGSEEDEPDTLGMILAQIITGDEWDRQSLLTSAGIEAASFERMLHDDLDLTHQSDVGDVQQVLNVIRLDDWRGSVRRSLSRSQGGLPRARSTTERAIAARSFAGVSESERQRDLMRGQSVIDDSPGARDRAIHSYLCSLEKELDDAE